MYGMYYNEKLKRYVSVRVRFHRQYKCVICKGGFNGSINAILEDPVCPECKIKLKRKYKKKDRN